MYYIYILLFVFSSFSECVCFPGLGDGGPPSGCSLQSQSSFDFCSPPTPSQTQAQGQGDPFQTSKDNSPFPEAEVINPFGSSTGIQEHILIQLSQLFIENVVEKCWKITTVGTLFGSNLTLIFCSIVEQTSYRLKVSVQCYIVEVRYKYRIKSRILT